MKSSLGNMDNDNSKKRGGCAKNPGANKKSKSGDAPAPVMKLPLFPLGLNRMIVATHRMQNDHIHAGTTNRRDWVDVVVADTSTGDDDDEDMDNLPALEGCF